MSTGTKLCRRCGKQVKAEEVVLFWSFEICYECNRGLAGVLRQAAYTFIGISAPVSPDQLKLL